MAHIQHLGSCLLDCGAQPRFLLGAAVRRSVPVHCRARGGESASAAGALQNFVSWHGACGHKPKSFVHEQPEAKNPSTALRTGLACRRNLSRSLSRGIEGLRVTRARVNGFFDRNLE